MFDPQPRNGEKHVTFPLQCILLKFNGAWPLRSTNSSRTLFDYVYLGWAYALIVLVALTCYAQAAFLLSAWGNILIVTECGCTVFMGIHNLLRLIHLSWKRQMLKRIINDFADSIWISKTTDKKLSDQCDREMDVLRYISWLQFILIWMYIALPLFELLTIGPDDPKPYPYRMSFPYNANEPVAYGITYFLTSLAGYGVVTNLFSEDSLFAYFTTHTCGRLKLLHSDIANILRNGQRHALANDATLIKTNLSHAQIFNVQREYKQQLIKFIHDHNTIIRFYRELQDFFSPVLLVNYTISALLICMVGIQIVAVKLTFAEMMKLVVYIVSALSQLFILCWKGDDLLQFSVLTADKLYDCNWEGNPINDNLVGDMVKPDKHQLQQIDCPCGTDFLRLLRFGIARSQKPLVLKAMKFSALALPTFSRIFNTSISYFTVLQSIVEQDG